VAALRPAIATFAAALLVAGCSFGTDDPNDTVEDFYEAVADGDVPAACEEIVPDAQVYFYPQPVVEDGVTVGYRSGCTDPKEYELDPEYRSAVADTKVISARVDGDTAKVKVEGPSGDELILDLVRIDEHWRLKAPAEQLSALDSEAKSATRIAQSAIEAYADENRGSYLGADAAALRDQDPGLADAYLSTVRAGEDTYEVGVTSASGTEFTIELEANGEIVSRCDDSDLGGCAADGVWSEFAGAGGR
jgi:hypothetical protein